MNGNNNLMWLILLLFWWLLLSLSFVIHSVSSVPLQQHKERSLTEDERIEEYNKRNYTWPIDNNYKPNTEGWKQLMDERFHQIEEIDDPNERYEAYIQMMHSSFLVPNYTEHGFGLARCPQDLLIALQNGIHDGLQKAEDHGRTLQSEYKIPAIEAPNAPWMIRRPDLTKRVLEELQHYAETWANVPLTPSVAYGFRLYRNESQLYMHVDKPQTHIISFILHIDSSDDAEPWPIIIEDFHGKTHEVILTPGDILFYESSKCWHGRPKPFRGTWYTSVFVHYRPSHGWSDINHLMEGHYAVPPHWFQSKTDKKHPSIQMKGTSMTEPDCPNDWCRTVYSKKWSGPGEEGFWIAPSGDKYVFEPEEVKWNEEL